MQRCLTARSRSRRLRACGQAMFIVKRSKERSSANAHLSFVEVSTQGNEQCASLYFLADDFGKDATPASLTNQPVDFREKVFGKKDVSAFLSHGSQPTLIVPCRTYGRSCHKYRTARSFSCHRINLDGFGTNSVAIWNGDENAVLQGRLRLPSLTSWAIGPFIRVRSRGSNQLHVRSNAGHGWKDDHRSLRLREVDRRIVAFGA